MAIDPRQRIGDQPTSAVVLTGGTIDGVTIGATTPPTATFATVGLGFTDVSATPATAITVATASGRFALTTTATSVVVTAALCTANSKVFVQQETIDANTTSLVVTVGTGTFTVVPNAASAGQPKIRFAIFN